MNRSGCAAALLAMGVATPFSVRAETAVAFNRFEYTGYIDGPADKVSDDEFRNPILPGFYPDPSVCRVGDTYYLINSTFAYFPGIPIFRSKDLVNWEHVGHVIHREKQLNYDKLGVSRGLFAPALSYHDGVFYVVCTMVDGGGNFVVTATDPKGPWSDPTWLGFEGIDPSIFFDDHGRAWMVNNGAPEGPPLYSGHRAIWIQEFSMADRKMIGPRKVLVNGGVNLREKPVWIEGPHLYKRDGWYYLCCAEGGTSVNHSQVIFRSRNVDGPYTPWSGNPILTQRGLDGSVASAVTSTGHADLVIGPDEKWWAVFLGVRPYEGRYSPMGRETFLLPVSWTEDGWPRILPSGDRVPLKVRAPTGAHVWPDNPVTTVAWSDDFTAANLSPLWIMLRASSHKWWQLDGATHRLLLTPQRARLSGDGNPAFLARRVQHACFTAETSLSVPSDPGVSAGLVVFQAERYHYFLNVSRGAGGLSVRLEKACGGAGEVVATTQLAATPQIALRVEAKDAACSFAYAVKPGEWKTLVQDADAKVFTTEVAGGFVGATIGVHARIDDESVALRSDEEQTREAADQTKG
jgi:alpha-N-arabinofuranosidase